MLRPIGFILFFSTGCLGETDPNFDHLEGAKLTTCIQYEVNNFGDSFESCKVILQFYYPSNQQHSSPSQLAEGECLYYGPGEKEEPPMFNQVGIDAGDSITLHNSNQSIELMRFEENGSVQYSLANCNDSNFPFGQLLDVSVSGSSLTEGVPAFELSNAILVNPNIDFQTSSTEAGSPTNGSDYEIAWLIDSLGSNEASFLDREDIKLTIDNWLDANERDYLECNPSTTGMLIEDSVLGQLQAHDTSDIAIEWGTFTTEVDLPWGERFSSYSGYRLRGDLDWE
jgi:hypothetical protein